MVETQKVNEDGSIDWGLFDNKFVKLEENEPVDLILSGWRQTIEEFKDKEIDAIKFDVTRENGEAVGKTFTVTSKRLAGELKPMILAAESKKENEFKVRITRTGLGMNTRYSVKAL